MRIVKDKPIYVVAITGASGSIYGVRLVQELMKIDSMIHLLITEAAWQVFREEMGWDTADRERILTEKFIQFRDDLPGTLHYHEMRDFTAPIASGSYRSDAMVVVPCSMGTLSAVSQGSSRNLLERTADVMLKEGKKLILVPRETPLNSIHLENMLKLSRMGVHILPAMPGFYHQPQTMEDLIDFVVGKTLDFLGVDHELFRRWGDQS